MAITWEKIALEKDVIKHALATAESDFLVASGAGTFVKKTLVETKTILGVTAGGVDEVARDNIVILAWKLAIANSLAVFNLEDGVIDEFEDETGVDTVNSLNENYNPTDDYYNPSEGLVIDLMEYSSDALAQAAYVKNASAANEATGGTITHSGAYTIHTFTANGTFNSPIARSVEVLLVAGGGGGGGDGFAGAGAGNGGGGAGGLIYNTNFAISSGNITVTVGTGGAGGAGTGGYNNGIKGNDSVFSTYTAVGGGFGKGGPGAGGAGGSGGGSGYSGAGGDADYISPRQGYDGGAANTGSPYAAAGGGGSGGVGSAPSSSSSGGSGGPGTSLSISGSSVTYAAGGKGADGSSAGNGSDGTDGLGNGGTGGGGGYGGAGGDGIVVIKYLTAYALQSYSESSIKAQGSYSLKGIAAITSSLNATLTKSSLSVDLSGINSISFSIRASRAGSNIKVGIHDSGGTTTEITPNIASADVFQGVTWDISGVADANKNVIDSIIITIVNAGAENTFYIDNFISSLNNMTLISNSKEAEVKPTNGRFLALVEPVDSITINTDVKGYISTNDGTNYDEVTLTDEGYFDTTKKVYSGNVTLTDRSDKTMRQKLTTLNNKNLKVHAWSMLWS
jgi:hypothetical protein